MLFFSCCVSRLMGCCLGKVCLRWTPGYHHPGHGGWDGERGEGGVASSKPSNDRLCWLDTVVGCGEETKSGFDCRLTVGVVLKGERIISVCCCVFFFSFPLFVFQDSFLNFLFTQDIHLLEHQHHTTTHHQPSRPHHSQNVPRNPPLAPTLSPHHPTSHLRHRRHLLHNQIPLPHHPPPLRPLRQARLPPLHPRPLPNLCYRPVRDQLPPQPQL